ALYIDGKRDKTNFNYTPSGNFSLDINAGLCNSGNFKGSVDEVRVYNRILTPQEIKRLYNMGNGLQSDSSQNAKVTNGLVGLWTLHLAARAGTTAYDRSGQGNNGTLTNGPLRTPGILGQGLDFTSSKTQYVSVPTAALVSCATGGSFTLAGWIKLKD